MRIGKIRNIDIKLNISTLLIVGLVAFYSASLYLDLESTEVSLLELFIVGIINGIILLVSILLHELMHSIMAQKYGLKVREIELNLFGGVSKIEEEPRTAKSEFIISGVGPLTSLILGGIALLISLLPLPLPKFIIFTLFYSGFTNIILGIFNLIPAFPMDGGRVLRSILWQRRKDLISATKTASRVGVFFGYAFIFWGIAQIFLFGVISSIWLIFIGTFVISSAKNAFTQTLYQLQLSQINARDIIRIPKVFIPYEMSIQEALHRYFMVYKFPYFPVIQGALIVGIIHVDDIKKIPNAYRFQTLVGSVMREISEFPQVQSDENGKDVLTLLNNMGDIPHIAVVEDENNRLIGFIGTEDIVTALKYAQLISQNR
ncbi:MAG: site-2 protease family protein [Promethearchaeota archaeon]